MTRSVVWMNGAVREDGDARVQWSDRGFTVGHGVFETIELRDGHPFALRRHLERLHRSADLLRITLPPPATLRTAVQAVAAAWGPEPGRLRITVSSGDGLGGPVSDGEIPTVTVSAVPLTLRTAPTRVITVPFTRNEHGATVGAKTTSYAENVLALQMAHEAGASEAIFANTAGLLCEGAGSNVFVVDGDRLCTPPTSSGCLEGVTRALLLDALERHGVAVAETDLPLAALAGSSEAFLVSTSRHVQPISHVDDRALTACPGPFTLLAAEAWRADYADAVDP